MRLNVQSKPSSFEFILFTKDVHQFVVCEKYTHVRTLGLIAELDGIEDAHKHLNGYALYLHMYYGMPDDDCIQVETRSCGLSYNITAPANISVEAKDVLFPLTSFRLMEMYPTNDTKFYLLLDRMNNQAHRQFRRKLKAGKTFEPIFGNIMKRK